MVKEISSLSELYFSMIFGCYFYKAGILKSKLKRIRIRSTTFNITFFDEKMHLLVGYGETFDLQKHPQESWPNGSLN